MVKPFKYQWLMDQNKIKAPCPYKNCFEAERTAFRFGYDPVQSEKNFLPNLLYNDQVLNKPIRFNSEEDVKKCGFCSLSMFTGEKEAKHFWLHILQQRTRNLLKFTHILIGNIYANSGVVSDDWPHFELFEYEGVDLKVDNFEVFGLLEE